MTFLNGLLAFGAAAFAVPLVIHLLHRSKFQTIEWGAMHLLQSSQNANSRKMQWQQLLLLLLRCMIPILLALAMSRPLFQSWLSDDQTTPVSLAIILDDSMSMFASDSTADNLNAPMKEQRTRWRNACDAIESIVEKLPRGSDVALVLAGGNSKMLESHAPAEVIRKILEWKERKLPAGTLDLDSAMRESLKWLSQSSLAKRQLVIVSDWQQNDWSKDGEGNRKSLQELVKKQAVAPELAFLNAASIPSTVGERRAQNLMVESIVASPSVIAVDRDINILTTLANPSAAGFEKVMVAVYVNDVEIDRQEITVASQSTLQMRTRWSPKAAGLQVIRATILHQDALAVDDSKSLIAEVNQPLPILLVDGDVQSGAMQSETDFIKIALSPFSLLQSEKGDLFKTRTIQPQELNRSQLNGVKAVVLCNVPELGGEQQSMLREFVEAGGGLVVLLGDKVRTEHYNAWPTAADKGLRIATLSARSVESADNTTAAQSAPENEAVGKGVKLQVSSIQREPLNELSSISLSSIEKTLFSSRTPIDLAPGLESAPYHGSVSFRFEDKQPWIIQASVGSGKCIWVGSSLDDDDSNIPSRPAFLPLVQKIIGYVASAKPIQRTQLAGVAWDLTSAIANERQSLKGDGNSTWKITKPDGTIVPVTVSESSDVVFEDTRMLGTYLFHESPRLDSVDSSSASSKTLPTVRAAIEVGASKVASLESSTVVLATEEMNALAKTWDASVSNSAEDYERRAASTWHGKEIWTWLWGALVVVFLSEMALEQFQSPRLNHKSAKLQGASAGVGAV
jgi:hypothetical protein